MKKFIVEQMNKGMSLEEIHAAVEQMFNEEREKKEEEKRQKMQAEARRVALETAAQATTDYFNLILKRDAYKVEDFKEMLEMLTKDIEKVESAFGLKQGNATQTKVVRNGDEEALAKFLKEIGVL
jgi:uncharacterized protein YutE (UPF0331/DUF86 family)